MLNADVTNAQILSHFSAKDAPILEAALALLPVDDEAYHRPAAKQVAQILLSLQVNLDTLIATLLSDPRLVGQLVEANIIQHFGNQVMTLIKDANWLNAFNIYSLEMAEQPQQCEILRRMLLSMTHDARAVIIKLAYRVQRLYDLSRESDAMRRFIAQETLDIYAPIANRLGVSQLKWELEDLAFHALKPEIYHNIVQSLAANRTQRQVVIDSFIIGLQQHLQNAGINAEIMGRPKHIYSIWKKMQKKQLAIGDLYDLLAVRVIVDDLDACYETLGMVLAHWQLIPNEFDDYIVHPKENGYQSLHAVIQDSQGNQIEVQIRTQAMDEFAEFGVAAHWRYKEGGHHHAATEKNIATIRQLLNQKRRIEPALENFNTHLFYDRVYVLTPTRKLLDLVKGATPLDFAYAIHTEVGHSCRGAKVNGRIVNLTYALQSGDQVEILTTKQGQPNRNWLDANLGYLKSSRAISKVKSWFKQQQNEQNKALGKAILEKETQRLGLAVSPVKELCKAFNEPDNDALLIAIGRGDISLRQIAGKLTVPELAVTQPVSINHKPLNVKATILVDGISNVLTSLAHCCNPIPGDAIRGFISHTQGITVHRYDCVNLLQHLAQHREQVVAVEWLEESPPNFASIIIQASQSESLVNNVKQALNQANLTIHSSHLKIHENLSATLSITLAIKHSQQLKKALSICKALPHVAAVKHKI
ncbi:MAG: bifunctional (p)ppGpp synthetase/guanosine-3',5'-bis(diphosphate) 3'-pyrophosphohydrolase [Methylococcaceae bacterium]|nr:bifunctional (p)ppGpp synthetase/guanosine-3',5'-bis(diphosphate) 3'-pyrophosphohydrolase [Methylococcaceae bacterium]